MHMLSKKTSARENWKPFENPGGGNDGGNGQCGKCRRSRKHKKNVHDLNLFVTVQTLEDTPAHGYLYEWASGQKPRKIFPSKAEIFVTDVVPGMSSNSGASSPSASLPLVSLSSSSPASLRSDEMASGNRRDPPKTKNQDN